MRDDHFTFTADDGEQIFVYRWRPDVGIGKAVIHIAVYEFPDLFDAVVMSGANGVVSGLDCVRVFVPAQ